MGHLHIGLWYDARTSSWLFSGRFFFFLLLLLLALSVYFIYSPILSRYYRYLMENSIFLSNGIPSRFEKNANLRRIDDAEVATANRRFRARSGKGVQKKLKL